MDKPHLKCERLTHLGVMLEPPSFEWVSFRGGLYMEFNLGQSDGSQMGTKVSSASDASAFEQLTVPPCPEEYVAFVKETPLERLVYWKLRDFFSKFEGDLPANVLKVVLTHIERPLFSLVLEKTEGNQSKAAEVLGCNRNTLHRKLKDLAIAPMELRKVIRKERTKRRFKQLVADKFERVLPHHSASLRPVSSQATPVSQVSAEGSRPSLA